MGSKKRPPAEADLFALKRAQDFGKAQKTIHFSGQDSVYHSDSVLADCNRKEEICCYINRGSELNPSHSVSAYCGYQTKRWLWCFENDRNISDVAIDKRCRYAAVAAEDGIYILEANSKPGCSYPNEGNVIRPDEWGVLKGFADEKAVELAFDENDRLHVREYSVLLCPEDAGDDYIRYMLDIDRRQALDENGILSGVMEDARHLTELALCAPSPELRFLALANLGGQETILRVYETDADERLRLAAVHCLTIQAALADIAANDPDDEMRKAAVSRLDDQALLEKIYFETERIKDVRYAAWDRLKALKKEA